ncbi:MAG TPA: hypothetical protein DCQ83_00650 [Fibrobacteres bacterium]|nr:hypothetical protein [Fibrobacterota bacterium]
MLVGALLPVIGLFAGRGEEREVPVFQIVEKGQENPAAQVIQFEDTQLFMEFPTSAGIQEIQKVVQTRFPENKLLPGDPNPGRIRFEKWDKVSKRIFPLYYALISGLLIFSIGFYLKSKVK